VATGQLLWLLKTPKCWGKYSDYQCMQASQQQTSSAYINRDGGAASSGQTTNDPLFIACMNAKGWSLQRQSANSAQVGHNKAEVEVAVKANKERQESICADPNNKTACGADKITFEQLADTSKISPAAKAIFAEQRNSVDVLAHEIMDLQRKYGGTIGAKREELYMTTAKIQNDQNNLNLYNGPDHLGRIQQAATRNL
jgi:hypothetical protein